MTDKYDISTTIESQYGHDVTRRARSESRIGIVAKQEHGTLLVDLRVNKNGAITLKAQSTAGLEDAILFDGRILAAAQRYGVTSDGLALLEVRDTPPQRTGYEGEPAYDVGYRAGLYAKPYDLGQATGYLAGKTPACRAGYMAALDQRQRDYMDKLKRQIKTIEMEEAEREFRETPIGVPL